MLSVFIYISKIHLPSLYSRATPSRPQTPHSQLRQQERETRELDVPSRRRIPNRNQNAHAGPSSGPISFSTSPVHPAGHEEAYFGVFDGVVCVNCFDFILSRVYSSIKNLAPNIFY